eukprot:6189314-Pleurochrysis_carterae.AAC.5
MLKVNEYLENLDIAGRQCHVGRPQQVSRVYGGGPNLSLANLMASPLSLNIKHGSNSAESFLAWLARINLQIRQPLVRFVCVNVCAQTTISEGRTCRRWQAC